MKKHTVVGQYAVTDRFPIKSDANNLVTTINLFSKNSGLTFGIGKTIDELISLGVLPSETGLDFLILGALMFAADTRISRATESQDSWTREIQLVLPVSEPKKWQDATPLLEKMLKFLTGDIWTFNFLPRPRGFSKLVSVKSKFIKRSYSEIALFSGGLDSLIGAIDGLETGRSQLFISHAGDSQTSVAQEKCLEELKNKYKEVAFNRLRVWMNFPKQIFQGIMPENTMRGRSFLFFSIGVFAGSGFSGDFVLRAPENGLIALNVPLDPLRLGSLSTRTVHPFYLACWNELISMMDLSGRIENPYWNKTKGEMIAECLNPKLLKRLIPITLSCSSPAKGRWQKHSNEQCGYCLPCLIRRAGVEKALGRGKDPTRYTFSDLTSRKLNAHLAEGHLVRSFQFAIERLKTNPGLYKLWIHKPGPLTGLSPKELKELADVYKRGMKEVATFLKGVRT